MRALEPRLGCRVTPLRARGGDQSALLLRLLDPEGAAGNVAWSAGTRDRSTTSSTTIDAFSPRRRPPPVHGQKRRPSSTAPLGSSAAHDDGCGASQPVASETQHHPSRPVVAGANAAHDESSGGAHR